MRRYSEKRDYIRMEMQCNCTIFDSKAKTKNEALLCDLSATGMQLVTHEKLEENIKLVVLVMPGNTVTGPLLADITVLRCTPQDSDYLIAARIDAIKDNQNDSEQEAVAIGY